MTQNQLERANPSINQMNNKNAVLAPQIDGQLTSTQNVYIIIVDDDPYTLELLSLILKGQGYRITAVNSGKIALEKVKIDPPDLIILDVRMPYMDGFEVCAQLKNCEDTKDIPVVFISALDDVLNKLEGFSIGGVDYISKPFALLEVLARVESHLLLQDLHHQLQKKAQSLETENAFLQNKICDRLGFNHELYKDLKIATDQSDPQNELQLYYQPIVDFNTGEILSFEALLRWLHPQHGMISPIDFIPLAECTGLINPIGTWIIDQAVTQLSSWNQLFPQRPNLSVSVNVSGYQLLDNSLFNHTKNVLQQSNIDSSRLQLEITESVLINDPDTTIKILNRFKQFGLQLYIDDFGTGYSTLSRLHDFPIDVLKIDRSFVHHQKWILIEAISRLAETLAKDLIVEGVETVEQFTALKNMSCHKGQGYYFSRPVDAVRATEIFAESLTNKKLHQLCLINKHLISSKLS